MKQYLIVFRIGYSDGREQPHDLSSGLSYGGNTSRQLVYDMGVNFGQLIGKFFGGKK